MRLSKVELQRKELLDNTLDLSSILEYRGVDDDDIFEVIESIMQGIEDFNIEGDIVC